MDENKRNFCMLSERGISISMILVGTTIIAVALVFREINIVIKVFAIIFGIWLIVGALIEKLEKRNGKRRKTMV